MQRKSLGKQILEIATPVLVRYGAIYIVEFVAVMVYYITHPGEMLEAMESADAMMEFSMNTAYELLKYSVQLTAIASLLALPFLIWMKRRDAKKEAAIGLLPNKKAPVSKYLWIVGISVTMAIALNNLLTLSQLTQISESYQEAAEALYTPSLPIQLICLGVIIPIVEEYIFRGLIYRRIRVNSSPKIAMVVSAIFFGIYHGNLVQVIYGTICGFLLAYLYEKYGSMKAPILAHVLINITAVFLTDTNAIAWMFEQPMRMAIITIVCAGAAAAVLLLIQGIDEKPEMLQKC